MFINNKYSMIYLIANKNIHVTISKSLIFKDYKYLMKYLISSKRSKALIVIGIVAISIGLISKKGIIYSTGSCVKETQELTFNI